MDIILYLLQLIQYQHKQICWLLNFICRYIPLKQWAFDDFHSPKYQKFKIDELPLITDFRQDWTYKELIPYYEKRYGMVFEKGITHQLKVSNMGKTNLSSALFVSKLFCSKNARVSRKADFVSKTAKILLMFVSRPTA